MRMDTTTYIMLFSMVEKAITGSSPRIQMHWLWSAYGIGQTIIFLPCGFFFLSIFFLA